MFIAALFTIAKTWNQPKCSSMILGRENVAHIHHGILCSHKKTDEFMSFVGTWMNLENHRSQRTNTRTENQTPHVLTHRRVLNNENPGTQGGEHHTQVSAGGGQGRNSSG